MAQLNCQISLPDGSALNSQEGSVLNVGSKFAIICEGDVPALNEKSTELRLDPKDVYKLKILNFESQPGKSLKLLATSYIPGDHQLKALQLVDQDRSVVLGDLQFTVKSVINPNEPEQEPYGPMGPFGLWLHWGYFLVFFIVLISAGSWFVVRWRRLVQKRKLIAEMKIHDSALQPAAQFYKSIRQLARDFAFLAHAERKVDQGSFNQVNAELEKIFRVYLGRRLQLPTFHWSDSVLLKEMKSDYPYFYLDFKDSIGGLLQEFFKAKSQQSMQFEVKDLIQLIEIARSLVDKIEHWTIQSKQVHKKELR